MLVLGSLGRDTSAHPGQPLPVLGLGPPGRNYKDLLLVVAYAGLGCALGEDSLQAKAGCH